MNPNSKNILNENIIIVLVKWQMYIKFLIGTKKLTIKGNRIYESSTIYKIITFLFLFVIVVYLNIKINIHYKLVHTDLPFILKLALWSNFISKLSMCTITICNSVIRSSSMYMSIIFRFSDNIKKLHLDNSYNCNKFRKILLVSYSVIFSVQFFYTSIHLKNLNSSYNVFFQYILLPVDLEIMNFVLELGLVIKLFKTMKCELYKLYHKKTSKNSLVLKKSHEKILKHHLKVFNQLCDILMLISSCYGIVVSNLLMTFYYNNIIYYILSFQVFFSTCFTFSALLSTINLCLYSKSHVSILFC